MYNQIKEVDFKHAYFKSMFSTGQIHKMLAVTFTRKDEKQSSQKGKKNRSKLKFLPHTLSPIHLIVLLFKRKERHQIFPPNQLKHCKSHVAIVVHMKDSLFSAHKS